MGWVTVGTTVCRAWQVVVKVCGVTTTRPWERGTNENTNRRIRRYLPKGTNITDHQPYLNAIAEELNEMPLKCLNWLTPREAYERLLTSDVASTA